MVFSLMTTVAAQEDGRPPPTVVRAPEGSETVRSRTQTPGELIGETCEVSARSENQSSVHPDNDLVVESGSQIVLPDVEAEPGGVVTATGTLVLSEQVVISLIMRPDKVFSAGIEARFQCPPAAVTTTTEATTTTAATTTTTAAATTITTGATTTIFAPTTTMPPTTSLAPPTTSIPDEVLRTTITQGLQFTGPQQAAEHVRLVSPKARDAIASSRKVVEQTLRTVRRRLRGCPATKFREHGSILAAAAHHVLGIAVPSKT